MSNRRSRVSSERLVMLDTIFGFIASSLKVPQA